MKKARKRLYEILINHVPENAVHYCLDLWMAVPFHFKVTNARNSKLGDYRYDPRNKSHSISVNYDLNKFSFLITYIHEIAHLLNNERHGRQVAPHGREWKKCFRELMEPILSDLIFPIEVLRPLRKHMENPKASTYADTNLVTALRNYGDNAMDLVTLDALDKGDVFEFNKRIYTKINLRRTRVLCQEAGSSKRYLISKIALVRNVKSKNR